MDDLALRAAAAQLWEHIPQRDQRFEIFIETMIQAEMKTIGPCSEWDACCNVAAKLFERIVRRKDREEAEQIFKVLAAPIKDDLRRMQARHHRELYQDHVIIKGWSVNHFASTFGFNSSEVQAIQRGLSRLRKKYRVPRRLGRPAKRK